MTIQLCHVIHTLNYQSLSVPMSRSVPNIFSETLLGSGQKLYLIILHFSLEMTAGDKYIFFSDYDIEVGNNNNNSY